MKNLFYGTATKRVVMRFVEIFVLGGLVALVQNPEFANLVPPIIVAGLAAVLKAYREGFAK